MRFLMEEVVMLLLVPTMSALRSYTKQVIYTSIYTSIYISIYLSIYIHIYICIHVCVSVCVCLDIHMYM